LTDQILAITEIVPEQSPTRTEQGAEATQHVSPSIDQIPKTQQEDVAKDVQAGMNAMRIAEPRKLLSPVNETSIMGDTSAPLLLKPGVLRLDSVDGGREKFVDAPSR